MMDNNAKNHDTATVNPFAIGHDLGSSNQTSITNSRIQETKERLFLVEIKQFCSYYMVIADKLKMSYEMSSAGEFDEQISKEELD